MPSRHGGFRHTFHHHSHRSHHHSHFGSSHHKSSFGNHHTSSFGNHHSSTFGSSSRTYSGGSGGGQTISCGDSSGGTEEWSTHLCNCFESGADFGHLVEACFLPWCVIGQMDALGDSKSQSSTSEEETTWGCYTENCLMSFIFDFDFCLGRPIFSVMARRKVVEHYNINEDCVESCVVSNICFCCAARQALAEARFRGQGDAPLLLACEKPKPIPKMPSESDTNNNAPDQNNNNKTSGPTRRRLVAVSRNSSDNPQFNSLAVKVNVVAPPTGTTELATRTAATTENEPASLAQEQQKKKSVSFAQMLINPVASPTTVKPTQSYAYKPQGVYERNQQYYHNNSSANQAPVQQQQLRSTTTTNSRPQQQQQQNQQQPYWPIFNRVHYCDPEKESELKKQDEAQRTAPSTTAPEQREAVRYSAAAKKEPFAQV